MKRFLILLIFLTITACSNLSNLKEANFQHFKVEIYQDGLKRNTEGQQVILERKPFEIYVHFTGQDSIFVNASYSPESYEKSVNGSVFTDITGFRETEITESLFNRDEILYISNNSPHFWHYTSDKEHRFNEVLKNNGIIICKRKISNIVNLDGEIKKISISDMDEDVIFLVIMKMQWSPDFSTRMELKRQSMKLIFRNSSEIQGASSHMLMPLTSEGVN